MSGNLKSSMPRRALLIINRNSRQGKSAATQIVSTLRELGFKLIEETPPKSGQLGDAVRRHKTGVDLVVIAGGDGTLNAAADALVETGLPLGIVPTGTANDLAHTLGLPLDIAEACRVIAQGQPRAIDLGVVNGKHYFNVAGLGLSVKITRELSKDQKSRWGVLAYLLTAMRVAWDARPFPATILAGEAAIKVRTVQITIGNGRYYGGSLTVDEHAAIDDGLLNLYSLEIDRWWQIIPILPAMWFGTLAKSPRVRTLASDQFVIETDRAHPVNADGELTSRTPAEFRVAPKAINVIVGKAEEVDTETTPT